MKQVEKLDRILRYLYEHRHEEQRVPLDGVVKELGMPIVSPAEVSDLGKRLVDDGVVDALRITLGRYMLRLNSRGVDYCEGRSYESASQPAVQTTTINITNSQQVALNNNSAGATASNHGDAAVLAGRILQEAQKDPTLTSGDIEQLKGLLEAITEGLANGRSPRSKGEELINRYGSIASIGGLITSFAQMMLA